jgi:hypothetical protein
LKQRSSPGERSLAGRLKRRRARLSAAPRRHIPIWRRVYTPAEGPPRRQAHLRGARIVVEGGSNAVG